MAPAQQGGAVQPVSSPSESPHSTRGRWPRRLAYAAGAIVLLTAIAWLAVPPLARWQLETRLTEALDRQTTIESVAFNPLLLRLTVRRLAVADPNGPVPLFAADELVADVSAATIWHRAPVFDAVKVVHPSLSLARNRDGRYSIQDLVDRALAGPLGLPRFSLNNVEIDDGSVTFDDGVTGRKHVLSALDVGVPFLSSLPYETAVRVTPRVSGNFNGSRFALGGSTTPFAEHREASLDVDVDALPLPSYVAYLPFKPRVDLAGGALTTRLKIVFVDGNAGERRLELRGDARVDGLAIHRRDSTTLAKAERTTIVLDRVDFVHHDARIASVAIEAPTVDVKRLADGTIEWAQPLAVATPAASKVSSPGDSRASPWQISIGALAIARGTVSLADATSTFGSTLVDVAIDASNLTTRPGEKAHVKLGFVTSDRIASFSGEADVEPISPTASGRFTLSKFSLGLLFPYYKSALAVDVQKGSLDFASAFVLDAAGDLRLTEGEATITDLRVALPGNRNPLWSVPEITARGVGVDVNARNVTLGEVQSRGAALRLVREVDGSLEMARLLRTTTGTGRLPDEAVWTVLASRAVVDRVAIDFEDRMRQPPVTLAVRELALTGTDLTSAPGGKSNVTVRARIGEKGRVSYSGRVARDPFGMKGRVEASGLALAALQPYLESHVNVVVTDGTFAAKGQLSVTASDAGALSASWQGDASVARFAALDKPTSSDLARWEAFSIDGMDVATDPFRASVGRIGIEDFYARVIVYQDGSLNLARLLTPGESPAPPSDGQPAAEAVKPAARDALPISIGRIDFERGNVNFSDFFVRPNYSVNLTDVSGNVSTMSADQAGNVSVVARLDRTAPVEIQGHIHPFAKELSLDIAAKARDVDLPPLTPYSAKYAGYGIEKGKLTCDVRYRVENRKLSAENHLILDQLTFGERVDSPSATKLPVLLAVALLKDSRGVIDIRLPIEGSLDDPKFSVGGLIVRVIVNLIAKAATAPFALLAAAFGGGEELSTLTFAAGSAQIGPDTQKRVDTLGKALADRPGLKLEIGGHADPTIDREALRHAAVLTAMKREKMKALVKEGSAPPSLDLVTIGADERDRWLREAYREAPLPDRPRNVIGMLKDLPPAEMEAMLYANATVDDDALRLLANARAQAVKDAVAATGVAGARLFLIAPRTDDDPDGKRAPATLMRVDLALR